MWFAFTMKWINTINTLCIIFWTDDSFTIIDICLTINSCKTGLTCAMITNLITIQYRMAFCSIVLARFWQTWIKYLWMYEDKKKNNQFDDHRWIWIMKQSQLLTISQLCPTKFSRHSHWYDPGWLIQVRAAWQGFVVWHSSMSNEQSEPVQPSSKHNINEGKHRSSNSIDDHLLTAYAFVTVRLINAFAMVRARTRLTFIDRILTIFTSEAFEHTLA